MLYCDSTDERRTSHALGTLQAAMPEVQLTPVSSMRLKVRSREEMAKVREPMVSLTSTLVLQGMAVRLGQFNFSRSERTH